MTHRLSIRFSGIALSLAALLVSAPALGGSLTLAASASGTTVTVTVTIVDDGGAPDCGGFFLVRGTVFGSGPGVETRCIARQVGTTISQQFVDELPANRAYHYEVVGMSCFAPCVCVMTSNETDFNLAFGNFWGSGFHKYVITGPPELTPVAHGQLVTLDSAYPTHLVEGCPGTDAWGTFASPDALQYVDTGTEVLVYGAPFFDVQNGPLLQMATATPWPCNQPTGVEQQTWGRVKCLYR